MKTTETTIATSDYYVNYYGQRLDIKPMRKIYGLFINGGGYGSGSGCGAVVLVGRLLNCFLHA